MGIDGGRSPLIDPARFRGFDTSALACADEVLLDGADHAEQGEHDFAHHVGPVKDDLRIVDLEHGSAFDDSLTDGEQVGGIAGESVWVKGEKMIAGFEESQGCFELIAAIEFGAIADIAEDDDCAELLQLGLLGRDV